MKRVDDDEADMGAPQACSSDGSSRPKKRRAIALECGMHKAVSESETQLTSETDGQTWSIPSDQKEESRNESSCCEREGSDVDRNEQLKDKKPGGIVIRGGRIRLPDKLMEFLTKAVLPDVLYWQEDGNSFSFDTKTVQEKLLNKYFCGSKLTSFARSLNRWGFKRVFCSLAPKHVFSYENPLFTRHNPEGVHYMDMLVAAPHQDSKIECASSSLPSSIVDASSHQESNPQSFVTESSVQASSQAPLSIRSPDHASAATSVDSSGQWEALKLLASSTSVSPPQPLNGDPVRAIDTTRHGNGRSARAMTLAQPTSANAASVQQQQQQQALQTLVMQRYLTDQTQNTTTSGMPRLPPSLEHLAPLLQAAFSSGRASSQGSAHALWQQQVQQQNGPACDNRDLITRLAQQCGHQQAQVIPSLLPQRPSQPQPGQAQTVPWPRTATATSAFASPTTEIQRALVAAFGRRERNQFLVQLEVLAGLWSQNQNQGNSSVNHLN